MTDHDLQARIDTLEMRLAHQDRAVEELNAVVIDHAAAIDQLKRQIALLTDRLAQAEAGLTAPPDDAPPPHY